MSNKIDFVVTWLDSSDPVWQKQYLEFKNNHSKSRTEQARFRNMDIFRYWFRAVETYAPWVNKVYLVTNGVFPKWINKDNPKLVLVNHSDYIPKEFLPTFNSHTIELHMHKIKGLSEHFVYFNDDMFINAPIMPNYYFQDGLPCDSNVESVNNVPSYNKEDKFGIHMIVLANIGVINSFFNRKDVVNHSKKKWYGFHLGKRGILTSMFLTYICKTKRFVGFKTYHLEQPYLKSSFVEGWNHAEDLLNKSCTPFREEVQLSPYFFRYWQLASNRFYPTNLKRGKLFSLQKDNIDIINEALKTQEYSSICLNDTANCSEEDFKYIKNKLHIFFEEKFPNISSFEIK